MQESEIIQLFYPAQSVSTLDDCALIEIDSPMLVTTDTMVEGVHFRTDWATPEDIASKLIQVNLSDLAISGGLPQFATLNLTLPEDFEPEWLIRFAQQFNRESNMAAVRLVGGDTTRGSSISFTITLFGRRLERHLSRSGVQVGDRLWLSGTIGSAHLGFLLLAAKSGELPRHLLGRFFPERLTQESRAAAIRRHLRPEARIDWARALVADDRIHAALDLSDGILIDLPRLCRASAVGCELDYDRLPLAKGVVEVGEAIDPLASGEELELLFFADPSVRAVDLPFPATAIGAATAGSEVSIERDGKRMTIQQITTRGFEHFS